MKRNLMFVFLVAAFLFGCGRQTQQDKPILVKINDYTITKEEFEADFKDSIFGRVDTLESRKEFLSNLINRKLILQDAQREGLDKDPSFLKMIERFWEQSLLKLALDRRSRELAVSVKVTDKDIEAAYKKLTDRGGAVKPYEEIYDQLKWEVAKIRESQRIDAWVNGLREKARITVNEALLKKGN